MADLKRYSVMYSTTLTAVVEVEAESSAAARDKANTTADLPHALCHQCSDEAEINGEWEISEVLELKATTDD